jgi:hypothetical protein
MIKAMMEAVCASETLVYSYEATRRYIPEMCHIQILSQFTGAIQAATTKVIKFIYF